MTLQYLGRGSLLFERLVTLRSSLFKLGSAFGKLAPKISYDLLGIG